MRPESRTLLTAALGIAFASACGSSGATTPDGGPSSDGPTVIDTGIPVSHDAGHETGTHIDSGPKPDAISPADTGAGSDTGSDATVADGGFDAALDGHGDAVTSDAGHDGSEGVDGASKDGAREDGQAKDAEVDSVVATSGNGSACTAGTTCTSGTCVDGVCCDTACTGTCMACSATLTGGQSGTCAPIKAGTPAPAGQCTVATCGNDGNCNAGACEQAASGSACGEATCSMGSETPDGTCSAGVCKAGTTASCAPYDCNAGGTACLVHCAADTDCASSSDYCSSPGVNGVCVAQLGTGAACAGADQCTSGYCYGAPEVCKADSCGDGIEDGSETGVDCGGPTCGVCPTVLVVGASSSASFGAELHPTTGENGTWSATTALDAPSVSDLGITFTGSGASSEAVSILRYTQMGAALDQALVYATWAPGATTLAGTWAPFSAVAAGVTTREVPSIAGSGSTAVVGFQGTDYNLYFASFSGGAWNPTALAVGAGSVPTPPGIAAIGDDAFLSYFNGSNEPVAEEYTGTWQTPVVLSTDESFVSTPSVVAMNGGTAALLTAFVRQSDGAILYAEEVAGVWSTPAVVSGAVAPTSTAYGPVERVGLAALPGGAAVLGWQDGASGTLLVSFYSGTSWSTPAGVGNPDVAIAAPPSLSHGVAGATVEMAFVESSGVAYHARYVAGAWTTPVAVGGTSLSHVTLTSAP